jgi:hypothetical protein
MVLSFFAISPFKIFCCEFSATSQSTRNRGERQRGSGTMGRGKKKAMEELQGYLALHVNFAHISPFRDA